jgi:hypothetical protein
MLTLLNLIFASRAYNEQVLLISHKGLELGLDADVFLGDFFTLWVPKAKSKFAIVVF